MVNISSFIPVFLRALNETFPERVWFVGLQGSYGRDEATEDSDMDLVVILDALSPLDVQKYNAMLDALPYRERLCGFLSGKDELLRWEPSDLFQFYYDTMPIIGSLDALLPLLTDDAIRRAVKSAVCNIYHGCVHNMLYEKSEAVLRGLYKAATFAVQAIAFRQTGEYVRRQKDLAAVVSPEERRVLETFLHLNHGGAVDFAVMSDALFLWAKDWIGKLD